MSKFLLALLATLAISFNANAATYSVSETFFGSFTEVETEIDTGLGYYNYLYNNTGNLVFTELHYGDASLFSSSLAAETDLLYNSATDTLNCVGTCQFTETLKNGDTIFGIFATNGAGFYEINTDPSLPYYYSKVGFSGDLLITGGTGLFAGATGYGTYVGFDDYTTMTETQTSTFTVTTVPEPETYAMLGAGLAIIGFAAKRRKAI